MLDRLDPQAKVLLEQLAVSTVEEPLPHQPLSSAEQVAAARLGYHQVAQLPGPHGPITLRLYQPRQATSFPVLVYVHGSPSSVRRRVAQGRAPATAGMPTSTSSEHEPTRSRSTGHATTEAWQVAEAVRAAIYHTQASRLSRSAEGVSPREMVSV